MQRYEIEFGFLSQHSIRFAYNFPLQNIARYSPLYQPKRNHLDTSFAAAHTSKVAIHQTSNIHSDLVLTFNLLQIYMYFIPLNSYFLKSNSDKFTYITEQNVIYKVGFCFITTFLLNSKIELLLQTSYHRFIPMAQSDFTFLNFKQEYIDICHIEPHRTSSFLPWGRAQYPNVLSDVA